MVWSVCAYEAVSSLWNVEIWVQPQYHVQDLSVQGKNTSGECTILCSRDLNLNYADDIYG